MDLNKLKQEAEEKGIKYTDSLEYTISKFSDEAGYCWSQVEQAYEKGALDFAEPREKQIQIDAEQIRALQKQNGELTDELRTLRKSVKNYGAGCYENGLRNGKRKLEQQIEKMKCCNNCRFGYCERSSESIDKNGNRTFHCWNEEKEKYCDVGKNGKYQCWELRR